MSSDMIQYNFSRFETVYLEALKSNANTLANIIFVLSIILEFYLSIFEIKHNKLLFIQ
jgi:hypothetical protein